MGYRDRDNCASHEEADRTFDISTGQAVDGMDADTDVTMYWVDEGSDYGIVLYVRVESMMGDLSYSITSSYSLSADEAYGDCEDYKRWIWQYEGNGEYEK
jgi:hypothetical protein